MTRTSDNIKATSLIQGGGFHQPSIAEMADSKVPEATSVREDVEGEEEEDWEADIIYHWHNTAALWTELFHGPKAKENQDPLKRLSKEQVVNGRTRKFGSSNPERHEVPFWSAMIEFCDEPYSSYAVLSDSLKEKITIKFNEPTWTMAARMGQARVSLPDGRIVRIGGEHEDFYDPDFCIYNDVLVINPDGSYELYGYPEDLFPPTDFHTATLISGDIYIVGGLGYMRNRRFGTTPVYRLNTRTLSIQKVETTGEPPGWIHKHKATQFVDREIHIAGGTVVSKDEQGEERHDESTDSFILDVETGRWRKDPANARIPTDHQNGSEQP